MKRIWNSRNIGMAALCCGLGLMMTDLSVAQQPAQQQQPDAQQQLQQRQQQQQQLQQQQQQNRQQAQRQTTQKEFCMATDVIGMHAKTQDDEKVGQIKNLLISRDGEVKYLAVETSGDHSASADRQRSATDERETPRAQILQQDRQEQRPGQEQPFADRTTASSGKLTLVPWELVKLEERETKEQSSVVINIEKDRLMSAPSFTAEQLTSQQTQTQLTAQVDQFFNVRSQRGAARPELDRDRQRQPQQPQPQDRPGINPRSDDN
jgi:hypothetical protein